MKKKYLSAGIILMFVALAYASPSLAQVSTPHNQGGFLQGSSAVQTEHSLGARGISLVIIWGTFEEKIHKFPLLSLEVRNRDPWDNRTLTVLGFFKQGSSFRVSLVKAYWVACVPLRSLHLGIVGNNSLFVLACGRIDVYQ